MDLSRFVVILAASSALCVARDTCENLSVIGGHRVFIKDAPFIAAIFGNDKPICTGVIIHESFVLTTARCASIGITNVILGTARLHKGGKLYEIEKDLCHSGYDPITTENDICLLKLKSKIKFSRTINKSVLPIAIYIADGVLLNVTGWGSVDNQGKRFPKRLQQTTVPKVSRECCSKVYDTIPDNVICAGTADRNACDGDEGAPLTIKNVLVGLYSTGDTLGCGAGPGIYTKVSAYVDWINEMIEHNS